MEQTSNPINLDSIDLESILKNHTDNNINGPIIVGHQDGPKYHLNDKEIKYVLIINSKDTYSEEIIKRSIISIFNESHPDYFSKEIEKINRNLFKKTPAKNVPRYNKFLKK
jgi:hypothetical protein